jgi:hypothetical protein
LRAPAARPRRACPRLAAEPCGQAVVGLLGAALIALLGVAAFGALGHALLGRGRLQRSADLAAVSAARSMREDFPRLFEPARDSRGRPNPRHLERGEYLARASVAAAEVARANGARGSAPQVSFPDGSSFAPLRVRVRLGGTVSGREGRHGGVVRASASAEAELLPPERIAGVDPWSGGYSGPFAYRQGKPMRPDVALAFDRMHASAAEDGVPLTISSAYRSDAEQARLFARRSDPRWVAPPGRSLHRNGTELDLGPPSAYGWLEQNGGRFGFRRRYAWEPWHYGYVLNARSTPDVARGAGVPGDARRALPGFVPPAFAAAIASAARRWSVSAALLAAQLYAESNFNPFAASAAGARGIAQFMPGTARSYGLRDPFDPRASIEAQAHMMRDLLRRFGSAALALAAYNAGPAAVERCGCVPAIPETQAYVARVVGLIAGANGLAALQPALEVRLVA